MESGDRPFIAANFKSENLAGKLACKRSLQAKPASGAGRRASLGLVSRLNPQKGIDVLAQVLRGVLDLNLQMVMLGSGDPDAERYFLHVAGLPPRSLSRVRWFRYAAGASNRSGRRLFSDAVALRAVRTQSDVQLALRHAAHCPLDRRSGRHGSSIRRGAREGTGFVFHDLTPSALYNVIGWAVSTWFDRPDHINRMRLEAMAQNFSWDRSAQEYEELYLKAFQKRRGHPFAG